MKTIMALSCLLAILGCGNKPKEGTPVRYEYVYSGTMRDPITWYEVASTPEKGATISYSVDCRPEITVIKAPADIFERIGAMAKEYKLHKLSPSYKPSMEILDGYGWHMFIEYPDDYIGSGGSNAWPPAKLWAGISAINEYIKGIIDASTEADIVEKKLR